MNGPATAPTTTSQSYVLLEEYNYGKGQWEVSMTIRGKKHRGAGGKKKAARRDFWEKLFHGRILNSKLYNHIA